MKFLILALSLFLSTLAFADSILVFEGSASSAHEYSAAFEINKNLGRAWVEVTERRFSADDSHYFTTRILVPGLSYDLNTKEVIFTRGEERIVCGELYNKPWVIDVGGSIRESDLCRFDVQVLKIQKDNGFEIKTKKVVQVNLIIE